MGLSERTTQRKKRMVVHRARDFNEAEKWDLEFWQKQSPEKRLSALVAIRKDVKKVLLSRPPTE